jgi:hypothetical protein
MRKWLPLAIALALLLTLTPFALAAGKGKAHPAHKAAHAHAQGKAKGKNKFQCEAAVFSVDGANSALVVDVKSGSKTVRAFCGTELPLSVAATAKLIADTGGTQGTFALGDLQPGALVHVGGTIDRSNPAAPVYVATKIILQRLPQATATPTATVTPSDSASPSSAPSASPAS